VDDVFVPDFVVEGSHLFPSEFFILKPWQSLWPR
jgi:hypothetical protein